MKWRILLCLWFLSSLNSMGIDRNKDYNFDDDDLNARRMLDFYSGRRAEDDIMERIFFNVKSDVWYLKRQMKVLNHQSDVIISNISRLMKDIDTVDDVKSSLYKLTGNISQFYNSMKQNYNGIKNNYYVLSSNVSEVSQRFDLVSSLWPGILVQVNLTFERISDMVDSHEQLKQLTRQQGHLINSGIARLEQKLDVSLAAHNMEVSRLRNDIVSYVLNVQDQVMEVQRAVEKIFQCTCLSPGKFINSRPYSTYKANENIVSPYPNEFSELKQYFPLDTSKLISNITKIQNQIDRPIGVLGGVGSLLLLSNLPFAIVSNISSSINISGSMPSQEGPTLPPPAYPSVPPNGHHPEVTSIATTSTVFEPTQPTAYPPKTQPPAPESPTYKPPTEFPQTTFKPPNGWPPTEFPPDEQTTFKPPNGWPPNGVPANGQTTFRPPNGVPPNGQTTFKPPNGYPPNGHPPNGRPPNGYPPNGRPPNGYPPNGHPSNGRPPNGYPPNGHPSNGRPPISYPPNGQPPNGKPPNGYPPNGQPPNGRPPNGYPPNGHPSNGRPPNGYPSNGHPSNGRPPNGYPTNGQSPNGYPTNGQSPNGYPTNGQPTFKPPPGEYPTFTPPPNGYPTFQPPSNGQPPTHPPVDQPTITFEPSPTFPTSTMSSVYVEQTSHYPTSEGTTHKPMLMQPPIQLGFDGPLKDMCVCICSCPCHCPTFSTMLFPKQYTRELTVWMNLYYKSHGIRKPSSSCSCLCACPCDGSDIITSEPFIPGAIQPTTPHYYPQTTENHPTTLSTTEHFHIDIDIEHGVGGWPNEELPHLSTTTSSPPAQNETKPVEQCIMNLCKKVQTFDDKIETIKTIVLDQVAVSKGAIITHINTRIDELRHFLTDIHSSTYNLNYDNKNTTILMHVEMRKKFDEMHYLIKMVSDILFRLNHEIDIIQSKISAHKPNHGNNKSPNEGTDDFQTNYDPHDYNNPSNWPRSRLLADFDMINSNKTKQELLEELRKNISDIILADNQNKNNSTITLKPDKKRLIYR